MRQLRSTLGTCIILLSLAVTPLLPVTAQTVRAIFIQPVMRQALQMTEPVKLVDHDLGFINAVTVGGKYYVAYQLRPEGQVVIAEHVGNALVPLPEPSTLLTQMMAAPPSLAQPSLTLPGTKQGSVSMVPDGTKFRVYFTGRAPGDDAGKFYGWVTVVTP